MAEREQYLWVEKYRPRTVAECILPESIKANFQQFVDAGEIPNLLLPGTAGIGKTTIAKALCNQLGADYIQINGSEESGIDVLRNKIRNFASSVSLTAGSKVVILDEADYLNPNSTQPALRGFIEEFASNCKFIMTCNYKNRIIEPLHSRCAIIEFHIPAAEKPKMLAQFMARVKNILEKEGVTYSKEAVARLLVKYYPDFRRVLNELQRYSVAGKIDEGILVNVAEANMEELFTFLKEGSFTNMRKWVAANSDNEWVRVVRQIWDHGNKVFDVESQAKLALVLGEYQYRMAFVADQELNMVAMLTEIMGSCNFKE